MKIDGQYLRVGRDGLTFEKLEDREPIHTVVAIPMGAPGIFVVAEVGVEGAKQLTHLSYLSDGNNVVRITVQNIYPTLLKVVNQTFDSSGVGTLSNGFVGGIFVVNRINRSSTVSDDVGIGGTRGNGRETVGIGATELPGAVTSHGVSGYHHLAKV